jgi:thioredoxin 1
MKNRLAAFAAALLLTAAAPAFAAEAFTQAAFQQAQSMGKSILMHVHAPWCPTCKAQEPTVSAIEAEKPDLKVFRVDFDSQKEVLSEHKVRSQSTLIVFKGAKETGRAVGITDPAAIRKLVADGMM